MLVNPEPLNISEEDIGRQAVSSLGGYIYQLYQTVAAWLSLENDDILAIEVAEDYALLVSNCIKQVQVRDTQGSGNVTLRNEGIRSLIDSHLRLRKANPTKTVLSVFLTTSNPGHEQGMNFPDGLSGLEYWNLAAETQRDIGPIKEALMKLELSANTKEFLAHSSAEVLRTNLVESIKWLYSAQSFQSIQQSIRNSLVTLGHGKQVTSHDSEPVEYALIGDLMQLIANGEIREVNRARLLRIFDRATSVNLSRSTLNKLLAGLGTNITNGASILSSRSPICKVSNVPLPPRIAPREQLANEIAALALKKSCMWVYGSTGLGKTTVSLLAAQSQKDSWYFVDLKNCSAEEIKIRLEDAANLQLQTTVTGIILDDFPFAHIRSSLISLTQLVSIANKNAVSIIITCTQRPPAEFETRIGHDALRMMQVPYMTEDDIAALITRAGGDCKIWTGCVYARSESGHPQLVDAYISGLSRQEWPQEKLEQFFLGEQPEEIQIQHAETFAKLMAELPNEARRLLCRLSNCFGAFDSELTFAIAEAEPALDMPNELLHQLLGPWIEYRGENRLVVSPLVNEPGKRNLTKAERSSVRNAIVDNLVARNPFPGEQLSQLLFMSFVEQNELGFRWFVGAMLQHIVTGQEMFSRLAQEVSMFASFRLDRPLCSSNSELSAMLRIVQLFVALETAPTRGNAIFSKAVEECRKIEDKVISSTLLLLLIGKVLMRRDGMLAAHQWLPLLTELPETLKHSGAAGEGLTKLFSDNKNDQDWTPDQFLFVCQATAMPSVDSLIDLYDALNELEPSRRNYLLDAFNNDLDGKRLMFSMPWVNESRASTIDGFVVAFKYTRLIEMSALWHRADLEICCLSTQAGLLTDYADGAQQALAIIEKALHKYPDSDVLRHRKLAILYKQRNYKEALEVFSKPLDAHKDEPLERAYLLRCTGICAFHIGDLSTASKYFLEGFSSIEPATNSPMAFATGLLADCALVEFLQGNYKRAVNLCTQSLTLSDKLDPEAGQQQKFCTIILGHLIQCLYKASQCSSPCDQRLEIEPGNCSNPDPPASILELPAPPNIALWYLLTACEVNLAVDAGAASNLASKTCDGGYFPFEMLLSDARITASAKTGDVDSFINALRNHLAIVPLAMENGNAPDPQAPIQISIAPVDLQNWDQAHLLDLFAEAILAFAWFAIIRNKPDDVAHLVKILDPQLPPESAASNFINMFMTNCTWTHRDRLQYQVADSFAAIRNTSEILSIETLVLVTYYLWKWLQRTSFEKHLEDGVTEYISDLWRKSVTQSNTDNTGTYSVHGEAVQTLLNGNDKGTVRLAALVIAGATPAMLAANQLAEVQSFLDLERALQSRQKQLNSGSHQ